ncbi:vigilin-like, partial [Mustelus asterias]
VFHVPLSDRRFKDLGQFGDEQAKICHDIIRCSGAHLELSRWRRTGVSRFLLSGSISLCRARKEIVTRLQTQSVISLEIPKEHHRFVIGRSGERLRDLELRTATKVTIPQPGDPSCRIDVSGSKEGVEKARAEIVDLSAEQDKRVVQRLSIDKTFHPFISGPRGQTAARISEQTGARINIPPPGVAKDEMVLIGDKEGIAQAVAQIHAIYEEK